MNSLISTCLYLLLIVACCLRCEQLYRRLSSVENLVIITGSNKWNLHFSTVRRILCFIALCHVMPWTLA